MIKKMALLLSMGGILTGCSNSSSSLPAHPSKGEYIFRRHDENFVQVEPMVPLKRSAYPWEEDKQGNYPKITKDFFRCRGSSLNPVHFVHKEKDTLRFYDCGGPQKHSLPLRDQKEFIYPILLDLLNDIQHKTGKRVVVTCGHCCPAHNAYLDPSPANQASKHMLGAEVDFYVQGMEQQPEQIIDLIFAYYREQAKYQGLKEFEEFKRYEKEEKNLKILPWYNKEIVIKLFGKNEGRDFDNRHPYSYICIQVRYDWDQEEWVTYSWDKVFRNFHRW
jgi:hypothetical protein